MRSLCEKSTNEANNQPNYHLHNKEGDGKKKREIKVDCKVRPVALMKTTRRDCYLLSLWERGSNEHNN